MRLPIQSIRAKLDRYVDQSDLSLDKIFDRFYQAEENAKHHQEGSGIGLTLVREHVKLMGGTIDVQSREGFGSRFTVRLPVTRWAPLREGLEGSLTLFPDTGLYAVKEAAEKWDTSQSARPVLLIVEDHADMTSYIRAIVDEDYQVITAANGLEGGARPTVTYPSDCDQHVPRKFPQYD